MYDPHMCCACLHVLQFVLLYSKTQSIDIMSSLRWASLLVRNGDWCTDGNLEIRGRSRVRWLLAQSTGKTQQNKRAMDQIDKVLLRRFGDNHACDNIKMEELLECVMDVNPFCTLCVHWLDIMEIVQQQSPGPRAHFIQPRPPPIVIDLEQTDSMELDAGDQAVIGPLLDVTLKAELPSSHIFTTPLKRHKGLCPTPLWIVEGEQTISTDSTHCALTDLCPMDSVPPLPRHDETDNNGKDCNAIASVQRLLFAEMDGLQQRRGRPGVLSRGSCIRSALQSMTSTKLIDGVIDLHKRVKAHVSFVRREVRQRQRLEKQLVAFKVQFSASQIESCESSS